ncbi:MAG: glycosyltransferase family 4 protein [Flavisolibacter sp.]
MIIVVNTRFLLPDKLEGYGYFVKEVFNILSRNYPQHRFYFLFDRPYKSDFTFSSNIHPIVIGPPARIPLLWKFWFDYRVPAILKKTHADIFVSPDGFCSLRTKTPQLLVVHDLGFLHQPGAYKNSHQRFFRRYVSKFLNKATNVATVSEFSRKDIMHQYKLPAEKISVVYNGVNEIFQPLSFDEQAKQKNLYTEGKEFFIYVGAIQPRKNLVSLLKAFSVFKKRQQTNMKLILVGRLAWKNDEFLNLLNTYKYKADVIMTGYLEQKKVADLMASAYALVYPSLFEGFGIPVLEAMRSNTPVLTSKDSSMEEIAEDAALYFNPVDHQEIADQMMLIYKDENLRKLMIERGKMITAKYSWERTAALLWQCIERTIQG